MSTAAADVLTFARAWAANPLQVGAIAPSGTALAQLITREVAHGTLGIIADFYDRDFGVAEAHYRRAIALNPSNSRLHSYYGWLLARLGRVQDGLAEGERAAQIDPLSIAALTNLASLYSFARQFDRAEALNRASLALDPNDVITLVNLATMYVHLGRHVEAVKTAERALTLDPEFAFAQGTLAYVYGRAGRRADARKILARLEQRPDVSPYLLASVHVGLGDHDRAFQQLNRAVEGTDDQISDLGIDAVFDPLRSDPRMDALLAKLKLKGYASPARSVAGE